MDRALSVRFSRELLLRCSIPELLIIVQAYGVDAVAKRMGYDLEALMKQLEQQRAKR
jgi:hypothetical protein